MTNLDTEPAPLPPPAPAAQPPERRWARSADRVLFGVAAGLGRALAIEPLLVRLAFVILALFSGVGIVLYIAAFLLLADSPESPPPSVVRRVLGAIAVLLCARWVFGGGAHLPAPGWVLAIGLFGAAVALWRGRATVEPLPRTAEVVTDSDDGSTTTRWNTWTAQRRDRPRPPRSALGLLTMGAAAVVGALAWLIDGKAGDRGTVAFGWATVVLGIGLLVGALAGRARWLIVPALATAAAAVGAAAINFAGVGLADRSGGRTETLIPGSTVADHYRTGLGDFVLSLVQYPDDVATSVDVGVGGLTVVVPDDARVQIDARIGLGRIDVLGSSSSGYRRTLSLDTKTGARVITLHLHVGVGSIDVRRESFIDVLSPITVPKFLPDIPPLRRFGDGTVLFDDGSIDFGDGFRIEADGTSNGAIIEQRADGSVQLDNGAVIRPDGVVVSPGGFVIQRPPGAGTPTTLAAIPTTAMTGVQP